MPNTRSRSAAVLDSPAHRAEPAAAVRLLSPEASGGGAAARPEAEPSGAGRAPSRAFALDAGAAAAGAAAKAAWWLANGLLARRIARPDRGEAAVRFRSERPAPDRRILRRLWLEAFAKDARDVATGLYPPSEAPPGEVARPFRVARRFLRDARRVDARRRRGDGFEIRRSEDLSAYPPYYRQNFHYQSDGWLSDESAEIYEAQVEALFSGAAGPMRRRALALLARALARVDQRDLRVLDLACGSGAFLNDLTAALPRARVMGLDLSLPYLREAGRRSGAARVQADAARLPFADASLDVVTCVYLFHELPPTVRRRVAGEIARVLRPGGLFAFADSVQYDDVPEIARLVEAFPAFFHEPYYESYQATDLPGLFASAGLVPEGRDSAFLTKALLFRRAPAPGGGPAAVPPRLAPGA